MTRLISMLELEVKIFKIILVIASLSFSKVAFSGFPDDLSDVIFVDQNISNWQVTANLSTVSIVGNSISLPYDPATVWPRGDDRGLCNNCNANVWVVANFGGQWYAATWEWLRVGQTIKAASSVDFTHINGGPFDATRWIPSNGEIVGFMVSGFARFPSSLVPFNVQERSNIVLYQYGTGVIDNLPGQEVEEEPESRNTVITPQIQLLLGNQS